MAKNWIPLPRMHRIEIHHRSPFSVSAGAMA